MLGLINGAFYALMSLGLAVIFGLLNIINFVHGALFMMGAMLAWLLASYVGLGYWWALFIAPAMVGVFALMLERLFVRRLHGVDPLYGLLLTFGLALVIEGVFRVKFGTQGMGYDIPPSLQGAFRLGFMVLPVYRAWVVAAAVLLCLLIWLAVEKTRLGSVLRAATENAALVQAFGINVPRLVTLIYALGGALAAFAGVLGAPITSVDPNMGQNIVIVAFAVVTIGGLGSIAGPIVMGFVVGLIEGLTKVFYPDASSVAIFVLMILVLLIRPAGLFGRAA
ncbi:MAG: branched-chain amino acid ABC transporter permease [Acidisphaera sp.]|nr:branched-chain amino acid ABC transporter permease [Acidisphaera sp.]